MKEAVLKKIKQIINERISFFEDVLSEIQEMKSLTNKNKLQEFAIMFSTDYIHKNHDAKTWQNIIDKEIKFTTNNMLNFFIKSQEFIKKIENPEEKIKEQIIFDFFVHLRMQEETIKYNATTVVNESKNYIQHRKKVNININDHKRKTLILNDIINCKEEINNLLGFTDELMSTEEKKLLKHTKLSIVLQNSDQLKGVNSFTIQNLKLSMQFNPYTFIDESYVHYAKIFTQSLNELFIKCKDKRKLYNYMFQKESEEQKKYETLIGMVNKANNIQQEKLKKICVETHDILVKTTKNSTFKEARKIAFAFLNKLDGLVELDIMGGLVKQYFIELESKWNEFNTNKVVKIEIPNSINEQVIKNDNSINDANCIINNLDHEKKAIDNFKKIDVSVEMGQKTNESENNINVNDESNINVNDESNINVKNDLENSKIIENDKVIENYKLENNLMLFNIDKFSYKSKLIKTIDIEQKESKKIILSKAEVFFLQFLNDPMSDLCRLDFNDVFTNFKGIDSEANIVGKQNGSHFKYCFSFNEHQSRAIFVSPHGYWKRNKTLPELFINNVMSLLVISGLWDKLLNYSQQESLDLKHANDRSERTKERRKFCLN